MKHLLIAAPSFLRELRKLIKRRPEVDADVHGVLQLMEEDPRHPLLKTHRLKGELSAYWACSAGYDLRIVFRFTKHGVLPAIELEHVGTHDEVY